MHGILIAPIAFTAAAARGARLRSVFTSWTRYPPCDTRLGVERYFNTEGPVVEEDHYCLPPLSRVDLEGILTLVRRKKYFLLHAPRQTGKTSILEALAGRLNASGLYRCVLIDLQGGQGAGEDLERGIRFVLEQCADGAEGAIQDSHLYPLVNRVMDSVSPPSALHLFLKRWAIAESKPLVLLMDEIDALGDQPLLSVVQQLRKGYRRRPTLFPQSVVLCGQHNLRDYRIRAVRGMRSAPRASPFNIVAKALRLGDFSPQEVATLLGRHTAETGQQFEAGALERVWELTRGQPWLVNALCFEACFGERGVADRARPIDLGNVENAKETLIASRVTHLDQLAAKLREGPVRRVIEPLLAGTQAPRSLSDEDLDYVRDLGLVRREDPVQISNPIYREVIPRQLASTVESYIPDRKGWYVGPGHRLGMRQLMEAFQGWYRENSEHWLAEVEYKEAGPHLLLQAFLHRVVNHGGQIEREYALGRGRTDILIRWPDREGGSPWRGERHVIECKTVRPGRGLEAVVRAGLVQTARYMDRCQASSGHLVVFDRRPAKSWAERIFRRDPEPEASPPITVWGV